MVNQANILFVADTRVVLFSDGGNNAATKIDSRYCYDFGHYPIPYVVQC